MTFLKNSKHNLFSTSTGDNYHVRHFRGLYFAIAFALSACATQKISETPWPEDVPPRSLFLNVYGQDETNKKIQNENDYLIWVLRFYEGWEVNPRGWNKITEELLMNLKDPQLREIVKDKMHRLGLLASGEWCKNNYTRTVNTKHVAIWGDALTKSLEHDETIQIIDRITADVEGLIAHKIAVEAITSDRFYPPDSADLW